MNTKLFYSKYSTKFTYHEHSVCAVSGQHGVALAFCNDPIHDLALDLGELVVDLVALDQLGLKRLLRLVGLHPVLRWVDDRCHLVDLLEHLLLVLPRVVHEHLSHVERSEGLHFDYVEDVLLDRLNALDVEFPRALRDLVALVAHRPALSARL